METLDCSLRYIYILVCRFWGKQNIFCESWCDSHLPFGFASSKSPKPGFWGFFHRQYQQSFDQWWCIILFVLDIQKLQVTDGIEIAEFSSIWELFSRNILVLPFSIPTVSLWPSQPDLPAQVLFVSSWVILQHGDKRGSSSLSEVVCRTSGLTSQLF